MQGGGLTILAPEQDLMSSPRLPPSFDAEDQVELLDVGQAVDKTSQLLWTVRETCTIPKRPTINAFKIRRDEKSGPLEPFEHNLSHGAALLGRLGLCVHVPRYFVVAETFLEGESLGGETKNVCLQPGRSPIDIRPPITLVRNTKGSLGTVTHLSQFNMATFGGVVLGGHDSFEHRDSLCFVVGVMLKCGGIEVDRRLAECLEPDHYLELEGKLQELRETLFVQGLSNRSILGICHVISGPVRQAWYQEVQSRATWLGWYLPSIAISW